MARRILVTALAAAGLTGAIAFRTQPLRAAEGGYQYARDMTGAESCGGACKSAPCCKIVPLN
jgi:hypothetical protein